MCEEVQKSFHEFLTSALNEGHLHVPAALTMRIEPLVSIGLEAGWISEHVWKMGRERNQLPLPRIDPTSSAN
jgi:hypothetical protein